MMSERCALLIALADDFGYPCATLPAAQRHKVYIVRILRGAMARMVSEEIEKHTCDEVAVAGAPCCATMLERRKLLALVRFQAALSRPWLMATDPELYKAMRFAPVPTCAAQSRFDNLCSKETLLKIDSDFKRFFGGICAQTAKQLAAQAHHAQLAPPAACE